MESPVSSSVRFDGVAGARPLRTLVVESDPIVRAGMRALIDPCDDLLVVGEVIDMHAIGGEAERVCPDVVVLSAAVGGADPVGLAEAVAACRALDRPVVLIVDPDNADALLAGIRGDVRGCVSRHSTDGLPEALRAVGNGRAYLSPDLVAPLFDAVERIPLWPARGDDDVPDLSEREHEVLTLLGHGLSNTKIAHRLGIKETTVRSHVHHILGKLKLQTRAEAIILAARRDFSTR